MDHASDQDIQPRISSSGLQVRITRTHGFNRTLCARGLSRTQWTTGATQGPGIPGCVLLMDPKEFRIACFELEQAVAPWSYIPFQDCPSLCVFAPSLS